MKITVASALVAAFIAGPCLAGPVISPTTHNMARELRLEPGKYSLNELMQIEQAKPGLERKQRIEIIDRQHVNFRELVRSTMETQQVQAVSD